MRIAAALCNWSLFLSLQVVAGCGGGSSSTSAGAGSTGAGGETATGASTATTDNVTTGATSTTGGAATGSGGLSDSATTGGSTGGAEPSTGDDPSTSTSAATTDGSTSGGAMAVCGDGVVESPEMCEPGEPECLDDCTYPPGTVFWTDIVPGFQPKAGARGWGAAFDADDAPLAMMWRGGTLPEGAGSYVKKYTRDGGEVWSKRWSSDAFPYVQGYALALQPDGSPVLVGQFQDAVTLNDAFVGRMSADGAVGWALQYELDPNEWFEDVLGLPDGSIVAVGTRNSDPVLDDRGWIVKLSPTGVEQWQDEVHAPMAPSVLEEAARLPDGRIVVFGCCLENGESLLRAYELDGAVAWTTALPGLKSLGFGGAAMTVDHHGDVVAMSRTQSAPWIGKYTADGAELWTKTPDDPALAEVYAKAMVATPQGRYVFGGYLNGFETDIAYGALDGDGGFLWTEVLAGAGKQHDMIHNLAVDSRGLVLAAGLLNDGEHRAWIRMFAP